MEVIIDVELLQVHKLGLSHSYLLINIFISIEQKHKYALEKYLQVHLH